MNNYSETHRIMNDMADVKMGMNAHKGAIEMIPQDEIIDMLREEIRELQQALDGGNMMHIIEESADCLNFLVALTHQQIQKYRSRKPVKVASATLLEDV